MFSFPLFRRIDVSYGNNPNVKGSCLIEYVLYYCSSIATVFPVSQWNEVKWVLFLSFLMIIKRRTFKVSDPRVQTFCVVKDSHMDAI